MPRKLRVLPAEARDKTERRAISVDHLAVDADVDVAVEVVTADLAVA